MPPVVKYSREKILEIGLKIVEESGFECISARNIAKELGSSICPIFSCFENMDALKEELLMVIFKIYGEYINEGMTSNEKPFKGAGLGYIRFAKEKKNYFKALFMNRNENSLEELLKIDMNNEKLLSFIVSSTGLSKENALKLHKHSWIFVHGIAVMVATGYCVLQDDEIEEMLSEQYNGLLSMLKEGSVYEKDNRN